MSFHKTNKRLGPDGILLIYNRHTSDRIKSPILQYVNYLAPIYTRHTSDRIKSPLIQLVNYLSPIYTRHTSRNKSPIPEILYNMIISKVNGGTFSTYQ